MDAGFASPKEREKKWIVTNLARSAPFSIVNSQIGLGQSKVFQKGVFWFIDEVRHVSGMKFAAWRRRDSQQQRGQQLFLACTSAHPDKHVASGESKHSKNRFIYNKIGFFEICLSYSVELTTGNKWKAYFQQSRPTCGRHPTICVMLVTS